MGFYLLSYLCLLIFFHKLNDIAKIAVEYFTNLSEYLCTYMFIFT